MTVARVIVDIPARGLSEPFDYAVPPNLVTDVGVGSSVVVPFGSRFVIGYVVALSDASQYADLKTVEAVLDTDLFDTAAVEVATAIATEYVCALPIVLRLFLPPGASPRLREVFVRNGARPDDVALARIWDEAEEGLPVQRHAETSAERAALIRRLVESDLLRRTWRVDRGRVAAVDEGWIVTAPDSGFTPGPTAHLQRAVLGAVSEGPVRLAELVAEYGSGVNAAVRRLTEVGALVRENRRRYRAASAGSRTADTAHTLTSAQSQALATIRSLDPGGVVVLDGVTGSGKTEIYLRAISEAVDAGKGAIVLVPEISLTPQTVGRFRARFGDLVAVVHSRLSAGERYDEWDRIRSGEARVVVGARSALFSPVHDLGVIIIDEEHESSYKQGQAPRYHARRVAELLGAARGARVILGSATPSFESLEAVRTGRYARAALPERVSNAQLPSVEIVDMGAEFEAGHRSMFSRRLLAGISEVEQGGHKAVLLLNRRGFASFILCRECGYVPECDSCSVSYTYHDRRGALVCHHCGSETTPPATCPRCGSGYLRKFGAGTERVEAELSTCTGLPIIRMDADTTSGKGGHERALDAFASADSAILLGTQMVAKGLDFPEVTLVGVINADTTLHLPDFRAGERTFQMLSQVAGRAGRGELPGHVVIQTYWPDHPAIVAAAAHERDSFYDEERVARQSLGYPPFGRLARVLFSGDARDAVAASASEFASEFASVATEGDAVLGPGPAAIERLKGRYRWQVLIKSSQGSDLSNRVTDALDALSRQESVTVSPDIDPVDLL